MIEQISQLNKRVKQNTSEFIEFCENEFYKKIKSVADEVAQNRNETPIILLSGPSGSGKTTTALLIENLLDKTGIQTHTLSLDNYFLPISDNDRTLLEQGTLDLESPNRVDVELLTNQLEKMIKCEPVELPKYDFLSAKRVKSDIILKRKPGEPVILEGIHSLNPDVVKLNDNETIKIYISVRTRVKSDNTVLHPSYIRLLRRMIRDHLYRGRSLTETIDMFNNVEIGEEKYIMPYKYRSDIDIDTFIPYELSVYKPLLLDSLKEQTKLNDIVSILSNIEKIDEKMIPKNSLIREFIGNSNFSY